MTKYVLNAYNNTAHASTGRDTPFKLLVLVTIPHRYYDDKGKLQVMRESNATFRDNIDSTQANYKLYENDNDNIMRFGTLYMLLYREWQLDQRINLPDITMVPTLSLN